MEKKLTELTNEELKSVNGGSVASGLSALQRSITGIVTNAIDKNWNAMATSIVDTVFAGITIGVGILTFRWV